MKGKKETFEIKKGAFHIDGYTDIMQAMQGNTRKPTKSDVKKFGLHEASEGDMSDYDIFTKNVKITIEIFD